MFNLMNTVKLLSYRVKFDKSPQILRKYIEISERMNEWAQALAQGLRGAFPSLPAKAHLQNPGEMGAQTGRGVK